MPCATLAYGCRCTVVLHHLIWELRQLSVWGEAIPWNYVLLTNEGWVTVVTGYPCEEKARNTALSRLLEIIATRTRWPHAPPLGGLGGIHKNRL